MDDAQSAKEDVQKAAPEIRTTLLSGVAHGISGLTSLVFFLAFAALSTLFVLKDGPVMHRFINRHLGVPERWRTSSRPTSPSRCAATSSA